MLADALLLRQRRAPVDAVAVDGDLGAGALRPVDAAQQGVRVGPPVVGVVVTVVRDRVAAVVGLREGHQAGGARRRPGRHARVVEEGVVARSPIVDLAVGLSRARLLPVPHAAQQHRAAGGDGVVAARGGGAAVARDAAQRRVAVARVRRHVAQPAGVGGPGAAVGDAARGRVGVGGVDAQAFTLARPISGSVGDGGQIVFGIRVVGV
mmetsp:Transcript_52002/g.135796  ORF Transcript_52002/g.135796 Transcript_52002/m.135796 type:complete len:208 (+) Transcript_52002:1345-1968(+)